MKTVFASFLFVLVSVPVFLTACGGENNLSSSGGGDGGSGSGGDTSQGGKDPGNPADLTAACKSTCAATTEINCDKWITKTQCEMQCDYLSSQTDPACLSEVTDYYACAGSIDYKCQQGYPQPATQLDAIECLEEQAKANLCLSGKTCREFCKAADAAGCAGGSQDACIQDCEAGRQTSLYCGGEYEQLRVCQTSNMACAGGKPSSAGCPSEKAAFITCLQQESGGNPCGGYCFIAQDSGCDTGTLDECQTKCEAALSPEVQDAYTCSTEMDNLHSCEAAGMSCQAGNPVVSASCAAEKQAFAACYDTWDTCAASCWLKNAEGCASGGYDACLTDCNTTLSAASYCDTQYEYYLKCQIEQDIACTPQSAACQSQKSDYDTCIANL